jgi:hypothetical protein
MPAATKFPRSDKNMINRAKIIFPGPLPIPAIFWECLFTMVPGKVNVHLRISAFLGFL